MHEVSLRDTVVDFKYFFSEASLNGPRSFLCVFTDLFLFRRCLRTKKKLPGLSVCTFFCWTKKDPELKSMCFFFSAAFLVEFGVR